MAVSIQRIGNEYLFKVPDTIDVSIIQRLIEDLELYATRSQSKATEEDIAQLARDTKRGWPEDIKERLRELDEFKDVEF